MKNLRTLLQTQREWLTQQILERSSLIHYGPVLAKAVPRSVNCLSEAMLEALNQMDSHNGQDPDRGEEFGRMQAQQHRQRGIELAKYLEMLEYYRSSFLALISGLDPREQESGRRFIQAFFGKVEIGFYTDWSQAVENKLLSEMGEGRRGDYQTVFRSLPHPVILLDRDNRVENINHVAAELFLWAAQEEEGGSLAERVLAWLKNELTMVTAGNMFQAGFEKKLAVKGKTRCFEVKLVRTIDQNDRFNGTIIIFTDITARKYTESALRESEEKYRTLFNNANDAIFLFEFDQRMEPLRYLEVNDVACRWLGYTRDELLLLTPRNIVASDYQQELSPVWQELVNQGKLTLEIAYISKAGTRIPVETSSHTFWLNDKLVALVVARDISARRQAEMKLRESEERYRRLVELTPDAIIVHCEGKIVFANASAFRFFGTTKAEDVIGKPVMGFLHRDYWGVALNRIQRVLNDGEVGPLMEEKIIRANGELLDVEVLAVPFTHNGKPAAQVIIRDITTRKKLEEEFLKTSKLESLELLAGGIAHDFNNILTIIMGNLSLVRERMDPAGLYLLGDVDRAALEAKNLTQQLLTFAKGGAPIKRVMEIEGLVRQACLFASCGSDIRCEFVIQPDLWRVEIDESQIGQVINNLIINAKQAMPEGGAVKVSAENSRGSEPESKRFVKLCFEDEGEGIPEENLTRIFDPYFTTKPEGSGLGLATVYSIIKKHGGYISVKSEVGAGTVFQIYLPACPI